MVLKVYRNGRLQCRKTHVLDTAVQKAIEEVEADIARGVEPATEIVFAGEYRVERGDDGLFGVMAGYGTAVVYDCDMPYRTAVYLAAICCDDPDADWAEAVRIMADEFGYDALAAEGLE
jgi:hypothetical protein